MSGKAIAFEAMEAYGAGEAERWRAWFVAHPEALDLPLGAGAEGTVRTLVKHVFAVELRYAQRLAGHPVSGYDQLPDGSVEALWRIRRAAASLRAKYLARATEADLARPMTFETRRLGPLSASAHKVVAHAFVHSIRHWAQVATVLRQHGHAGLWQHDWLTSPEV